MTSQTTTDKDEEKKDKGQNEQAVKTKKPKESWKGFFTINRKLIPLKIFMTFFYGGFIALYPYLTIHMKSLGISVTQIGIVYSVYPICVCLGGPFAGVLGDKTGRYKLSLMIFIVVSIILHGLLFFIVPAYSVTTTKHEMLIDNVELVIPCGEVHAKRASLIFRNSSVGACLSSNNQTAEPFTNQFMVITSCYTTCQTKANPNPMICVQNINNTASCINIDQINNRLSKIVLQRVANLPETHVTKWQVGDDISCFPHSGQTEHCDVICNANTNFTTTCFEEHVHGSQAKTFGIYLFLRLVCGFIINLVFTLVDASLIQMVEDYHGDVGVNRAFGSVGFCAVPPLSGLLIDYVSGVKGYTDYNPAFYVFAGGLVLSVIILCFTDIHARIPTENIWKNATQLLHYPHVIFFMIVFFFIGLAWGFLESFLFLFLDEDLSVPKWLLGFTNTVGGLAGVPFCAFATRIIRKTGYTKIFIFGLFMFGVRFIGYSYVYNPYMILPLEALEAFTSALPLVAASIYASTFSAELLATLQGVNSALHFGLGRGIGSLMGGFMIDSVGTRTSFRIFAGICFAYSLIHTIIYYAYLRRVPKFNKKPVVAAVEEVTLFQDAHRHHSLVGQVEEEADEEKRVPSSRRPSYMPIVPLANLKVWGSYTSIDSGADSVSPVDNKDADEPHIRQRPRVTSVESSHSSK